MKIQLPQIFIASANKIKMTLCRLPFIKFTLIVALFSIFTSQIVIAQDSELPIASYGTSSETSNNYLYNFGSGGNKGSDKCSSPGDGKNGDSATDMIGNKTFQALLPVEVQQSAASFPTSGLVAISSGGDGGKGGSPDCSGAENKAGKGGGDGGAGGLIDVTFDYQSGDSAIKQYMGTGIFAYSVGGNGGDGGKGHKDGNGGDGGSAGDGGSVNVVNYVNIDSVGFDDDLYPKLGYDIGFSKDSPFGESQETATYVDTSGKKNQIVYDFPVYEGSYGIWAQSAGGWGGDGGSGGSGGNGGKGRQGGVGGDVSVANYGYINTPLAIPIFAQSIGGNGGDGGSGHSSWAGLDNGKGGKGGYGSAAGKVTVNNEGNLTSALQGGFGIFAQSVGGGGGAAGATAGLTALGASGGDAAPGDVTTVTNSGYIEVSGASSIGIYAQSVGGGGGTGGLAVGEVSVGGSGGSGGSGANVYVSNSGHIYTGGSCTSYDETNGECTAASSQASTFDSNGGAFGIMAQSVGGGGGLGGMGLSASFGTGPSLAFGGSGGDGGAGGDVSVINTGTLWTIEPNSAGLLAQSVGGGGGSGGGAVAVSVSFGAAFGGSGAEGGDGGSGSQGGVVGVNCGSTESISSICSNFDTLVNSAVSADASISTSGAGSPGILAQSVGGGGGNGGFAVAFSASLEGAISEAYGGSGGNGGQGSDVFASPYGVDITTFGSDSPGIIAASIGGGGGNGGNSVSGAVSGGLALTMSMGGSGGAGGDAGVVEINNSHIMDPSGNLLTASTINTSGDRSFGLIAQSIGGGGGSGGSSVSASVGGVVALDFSIGGSGGEGNSSSEVQITNVGEVKTTGLGSSAIVAQSIGGGGGNAGYALSAGASVGVSASIAIGGSGGAGGNGADVTVNNTGILESTGGGAGALIAQSIGGGGGNGGFATAGSMSLGAAGSLGIGGSGGSGAESGKVSVTNSGAITAGLNGIDNSPGSNPAILAQSIAGGGGSGGFAAGAAAAEGSAALSFGGEGGSGGKSSSVTVDNMGDITSYGNLSPGLIAQSFGGAGGNGGLAMSGALSAEAGSFALSFGGDGGTGGGADEVTVTSGGTIITRGDLSSGLVAQSVGGSGGNGGSSIAGSASVSDSLSAAVGGGGATGGESSKVVVEVQSSIYTDGDQSTGVVGQSIGGSGGNGGNALAGSISAGASASLAVGGGGGGGGTSGDVKLSTSKNSNEDFAIVTNGVLSAGLLAQSIGGSGGNGGFSSSAGISAGESASFSLAGDGGLGGTSGSVSISTLGYTVITQQDGSDGIVAQSIGGNGGNGGFAASAAVSAGAASLAIGGTGATGGSSGQATINNQSNITTYGSSSSALIAQSIGGAGGNGGFSVGGAVSSEGSVSVNLGGDGGEGGTSSSVAVTNEGVLQTSNDHSSGLIAQSIGGVGGNGGMAAGGGFSGGGSVSVDVGGSGAGGGQASSVSVVNSGEIGAKGYLSSGVLAQSIGGSGGNGGVSASASAGVDGSFSASIGGAGGAGANAKSVSVDNYAAVSSSGDLASAIVAQSIGGNGGNGGNAISGSLSSNISVSGSLGGDGGDGGTAGTVSLSLINNGYYDITQSFTCSPFLSKDYCEEQEAEIEAQNAAALAAADGNSSNYIVSTKGDLSSALVAQSIGGGGGNGGSSASVSGSKSVAISAAVGGEGASGGSSNSVILSTDSKTTLQTEGNGSSAIVAQSIGGSGGNGGSSVSGAFTTGTEGKPVSLAVGGSAGEGASADLVQVNIASSEIKTNGLNALGIIAQSIGGSGGNGGTAQSLSLANPTSQTVAASVSIGGNGGDGGKSGNVSVTQVGDVRTGSASTKSGGSIAILAQSIGGGGGNGGNATTNSIAGKASVAMSVGGGGGDGGSIAGNVTVLSNKDQTTGAITTYGAQSVAILAQSIGGNGGNGGWSQSSASSNKYSVSAAMGGTGGEGDEAGSVRVETGGSITTYGHQAFGISAQSIGGGGGNGGAASSEAGSSPGSAEAGISAIVGSGLKQAGLPGAAATYIAENAVAGAASDDEETDGSNDEGISASFALGGSGGKGGVASTVNVNAATAITTKGDGAHGIIAQSIGGGGGTGGSSSSSAEGGKYSTALSVGGSGSKGAISDVVSVSSTELIMTTGHHSIGIYAQSIGGGGGSGGASSASDTAGESGIAAVSMGIGGKGADGGSSGDTEDTLVVNVQNDGEIRTGGMNSAGIYAQSIGGGGGNGGSSKVSASIAEPDEDEDGDDGTSSAGTGNSEQGSTDVASNSSSAGVAKKGEGTEADEGGSGAGADKGTAVGLSVGGFGGDGAFANNVQVSNKGLITTGFAESIDQSQKNALRGLSDNSIAIFAQSVGGGGGNAGSSTSNADASKNSVSLAMGGNGGTGGHAGSVTVNNRGALYSYGNHSTAIFAQSVGGGGGNGGNSSVSTGEGGSNAVAFGLGGSGGGAGDGGDVVVTNTLSADGTITTLGASAYGMFAQSVGGGGGNGGSVTASATSSDGGDEEESDENSASTGDGQTSAETDSGVAVAAGLGGSGGAGGDAGDVTLTSKQGSIKTGGDNSAAIFAQSVGGGGGNSGSTTTESNGGAYNASFAMGLAGGKGGKAGSVDINVSTDISTRGSHAAGIFAQSVGGGGGNGGSSSSTSSTSSGSASVSMALGADAGDGNKGGSVIASQIGQISTLGDSSFGLFAQSVGGGGGNGGSSQSSASGGDAAVSFSLGGTGGTGAEGGDVSVYAAGGVATQGDNAQGLFVQSIGGGGGNGGSSSATSGNGGDANVDLSIGGSGAVGANGGVVVVSTSIADYNTINLTTMVQDPNSEIITSGHNAQGIFAQSVGGGGGNGGSSSTAFNSDDDNKNTTSVGLSLGGSAGGGGNGSTVEVTSSLDILTIGDNAQALLAQSVGGGGGNGGSASTASAAGETSNFSLAIGASGGDGGNAQKVTVNGSSNFTTKGLGSAAIVAQSIGGGGGNAGASHNNALGYLSSTVNHLLGGSGGSGGHGGSVEVELSSGELQTEGDNSSGIIVQSISGGGGSASAVLASQDDNTDVSFTLGGDESVTDKATNGGLILNSNASVKTSGDNAQGIVAQSIGGGGGLSLTLVASESVSISSSQLGATSSSEGNSEDVSLVQSSTVTTQGDASFGVVAQSIGGGGGFSATTATQANAVNQTQQIKMGSSSNSSGNAKSVSVTINDVITTTGNSSVGILAQSIGGGGGAVVTYGLGLLEYDRHGGSGMGDDVSVTVNSSIIVQGEGAIGLFAQSIGGGGGLLLSESGYSVVDGKGSDKGGIINVALNGTEYQSTEIVSSHGSALVLSSDNSTTDNRNLITLDQYSKITNGDYLSAPTSAADTSSNFGNQWAVYAPDGYTNIINYGTITGNILLGLNGTGDLTNYGTLNGLSYILANESLHNYGVINAGLLGSASPLKIDGSLKHYAGGVINVGIDSTDFDADNALITVTGLARIEGEITPKASTLTNGKEYHIISSGSLEHSGTVSDTHLFDWSADVRGGNLVLSTIADFTPEDFGLTANELNVAEYLQRSWDAQDDSLSTVFGYVHQHEIGAHEDYRNTLNEVSGWSYNIQAMQSSLAFHDSLFDALKCMDTLGTSLASECAWVNISYASGEQKGNAVTPSYEVNTHRNSIGGQFASDKGWGIGFAFSQSDNTVNTRSLSSLGRFVDGSVSLSKRTGPWLIGGAVGFQFGDFESTRTAALEHNTLAGDFSDKYTSQSDSSIFGSKLRAQYDFTSSNYFISPFLDIDYSYQDTPEYRESGLGPLGLIIHHNSVHNWAVRTGIKAGVTSNIGETTKALVYVQADQLSMIDRTLGSPMRLNQSSLDVGVFESSIVQSGPLRSLILGVKIINNDKWQWGLEYSRQQKSGFDDSRIKGGLKYLF